MGMDITGKNPKLRGEKPADIDWWNASQEEKDAYMNAKNDFYNQNPGVYFRANLWSWRPIAEVIQYCNNLMGLNLPETFLHGMHFNSGEGLQTQEECDKLADAIDAMIIGKFDGWKYIGVNYKMYARKAVNPEGQVFEENLYNNPELIQELENHLGDDIFVKDGEFEYNNIGYSTAHATEVDHLEDFVTFLRECGGFEIW
jgi:hypothetical protein